MIRDLIDKIVKVKQTDLSGQDLSLNLQLLNIFNDRNFSFLFQSDQNRFRRYDTYDEILDKLPFVKRALLVWRSNILSPDDINKVSLRFIPRDKDLYLSTDFKLTLNNYRNLLYYFDYEGLIRQIIDDVLAYGDAFIELVPITSVQQYISKHVETDQKNFTQLNDCLYFDIESLKNNIYKPLIEINHTIQSLNTASNNMTKNTNLLHILKESNGENTSANFKSELFTNTSIPFIIRRLDPRQVIRLQIGSICFGFLKTYTLTNSVDTPFGYTSFSSTENALENIASMLQQMLIKKYKANIDETHILLILKELTDYLSVKSGKSIISYVPYNNMFHFRIDTKKYDPYGTSKLDSIVFQARLLIAMITALAIYRVSRAGERRVFYVETGLDNLTSRIVNETIAAVKQRRFNFSDNSISLASIPSVITTFEDIYIPVRDGKRFIEFDVLQSGDVATHVDDIKEMTKSILSGIGVPPPLLGIEEYTEAKATLAQENIAFARDVVDYQAMLSHELTRLMRTIYENTYPEQLMLYDRVIVTFSPPRTLQLEYLVNMYEKVSQAIQNLESLGVPKEYIIRDLLPSIDWDDLDVYMAKKKVETTFTEEV